MWNHRIIKHSAEGEKPEWYGIYEVFYNEDGAIALTTEDPEVSGESIDDLKLGLKLINSAFKEDVLVEGEFERIGFPELELTSEEKEIFGENGFSPET